MPQPLSRVRPVTQYTLSPNILAEKPEFGASITKIIGIWSHVEAALQSLMVQILGGKEPAAIAIYSILKSQNLQTLALDAVSDLVFKDGEQHEILAAVLDVAATAGKIRHRFAHWLWGSTPELPDCLLLADPQSITRRVTLKLRWRIEPYDIDKEWTSTMERILVYKISDIENDLARVQETAQVMHFYEDYLNPHNSESDVVAINQERKVAGHPPLTADAVAGTSAYALVRLSSVKSFQEALERIRNPKKNIPQSPP